MRALFWLGVGAALGVLGYRYYEDNDGRLPIVEQLLGGRTDELARRAGDMAQQAQRGAERAVSETTSNVARETVAAVAEEIADAEEAKRREQARGHA